VESLPLAREKLEATASEHRKAGTKGSRSAKRVTGDTASHGQCG